MKKKNRWFNVILLIIFLCVAYSKAEPLHDPTRPPTFLQKNSEENNAAPILTAIFIHQNERFAIIDNQILKKGDQINEFTITSIKPYTVELIGPGNVRNELNLVRPIKQQHIPES